MKKENPWLNLVKQDNIICAKDDKEFINNLLSPKSKVYKKIKSDHKLRLDLIPQHIIGDINKSKILILSLNPGWDKNYQKFYEKHPELKVMIKKSLEQSESSHFYAFDFYNELKESYWGAKLQPLINAADVKESDFNEFVDKTFCVVDFFPYHSKKYNNIYDKIATGDYLPTYLPTQRYVFDLIEERIQKNDVTIILARSFRKWYEAIPELETYEKCYECSNPQNPSFDLKNIFKVQRRNVSTELELILKEKNC